MHNALTVMYRTWDKPNPTLSSQFIFLKNSFALLLAASWVISPLMSGIVSSVIFVLIRAFILNKVNFWKVCTVETHIKEPRFFLAA